MPLTMIQSTVPEQLKERTIREHKASEAVLLPRLVSIQGINDYASILTMFYGFFHPLECLIRGQIDGTVMDDIQERRSSAFIVADLEAIGLSTNELPLCTALPSIESLPAALGAMYVLEGSTLGGRMIRKMLLKNPHLKIEETQLNFFNGYGDETGRKWLAFQAVLDRYEMESEHIIASAKETFNCFTNWMRKVV